MQHAPDLARQKYLIAQLHNLGPQPLAYFIDEIAAGAPLWPLIERYAALPADLIRDYGGDQFPPPAVFAIDGGR